MTPATIIREAQAAGVRLALSPAGNIKLTGKGAAVNRWLAVIRGHKAEIVDVLKVGCNPVNTACPAEATRAEMPEQSPDAIAAEPECAKCSAIFGPMPANEEHDLRTCMQCANLVARRCLAARRGEILASRSYEPIRDLLRRCEGYAPGTDDPDRRHGRERWPGLIQKGLE